MLSILQWILTIFAVLFGLVYYYFTKDFDYWKKRGIPYLKPLPFVGNLLPTFTGKVPFYKLATPWYEEFKNNGYGGVFQANRPYLVVCDLDLAKLVLTKEFSSFHDRGIFYDEKGDPLSTHLFNLEGNRWKNLRSKLSPTFTSGKIKHMFNLIVEVDNVFVDKIRSMKKNEDEMDFKKLLMRYATDVIGSCAFGVTCNSLNDEKSEFYVMGRSFTENIGIQIAQFVLAIVHPIFAKLFPTWMVLPKATGFFTNLMKETVEFREKNNIVRPDFVHLMMQLRNSDENQKDRENYIEFTSGVMAAQAFIFFAAGLDSVANTLSFCLHELALNPQLQEQAVEEVQRVISQNGGKITYEGVQSMELIDRIVCEGLRKYAPAGFLIRKVTAPFTIPGTKITIDSTSNVAIPSYQIQNDPNYFPDPERFDPDRFTDEAKKSRHPYAFLPFGEGPRNCIASRFAFMEMKLCLATLLDEFVFTVGQKTETKLEMDPYFFAPTAKNGVWLKVDDRKA